MCSEPCPDIKPDRADSAMVRAVPAPPLAAFVLLAENPGNSPAHFSYQFAEAYEPGQDLKSLSQMREVDTMFLTQASLPLVQLWGGRLRFDGFASSLNIQNMEFGSLAARAWRQNYPGVPHSLNLFGISLTFHFGKNAQIGCPTQIWRRVAQIIGAVR
jgi:hypothetical protein